MISGIVSAIIGMITGISLLIRKNRRSEVRYILSGYKEYKESYRNGLICGTISFRKTPYGEWEENITIKNLNTGETYVSETSTLSFHDQYLLALAVEENADAEYEMEECSASGNKDEVVMILDEDNIMQVHPGYCRLYGNVIDKKVNEFAEDANYIAYTEVPNGE